MPYAVIRTALGRDPRGRLVTTSERTLCLLPEPEAAEAEMIRRRGRARVKSGVSFDVVEVPELSAEAEEARHAAMGAFTKHFGCLGDETRRAVARLLMAGEDLPAGQKFWDSRLWIIFHGRVLAHCRPEVCDGPTCALLRRALEAGE